jgi:hypothetical protein
MSYSAQLAARLQDPEDFAERLPLIGGEVRHTVGDHEIYAFRSTGNPSIILLGLFIVRISNQDVTR